MISLPRELQRRSCSRFTRTLLPKHSLVSLRLLQAAPSTSLPCLLDNSLVAVSVVPLLAVGQEPVDDDATDGEDEDKDRPQELVTDGARRLEDLDCVGEFSILREACGGVE